MRIPGSFSSGVWYQPGYYEHSKIQRLLPIDDPALDSVEAQRMMQRLLADKINSYADIDELRLLLVSGAQADGVVTQGLTPLHYACHRDYLGAAKLLLVRGAKVNAVDDAGYSPLHLCAEKGNYRLLKLLLQYMARVCYVDPKDAKKEFPLRESVDEPLRMAIRRGHYECARLLLDNGADPNAKYFDGPEITHVSPLDTHFLRLLLSYGADPNTYGRDGLTPIMRACRHREKGIKAIQILLDNGADINAVAKPKKDLRTALHYAVLSGSMPLISFLIENGACANSPSGYDKPSPLDIAILKDDPRLVAFLLSKGADPNLKHGCFGSALHIACCSGPTRPGRLAIIEQLLRHGADPNLHEPSTSGAGMKSPMVEFLRCTDSESVNGIPNVNIFHLLLNYGGQILLRSPQIDPRGQLRNLMCLMQISLNQGLNGQEQQDVAKYLANLMLSLAEQPSSEDVWVIRKFAQMATTSEQVRKWVLDFLRSPRALRELSRLSIRKTLYSENGESTPAAVETLPVPIRQKNYILGSHY